MKTEIITILLATLFISAQAAYGVVLEADTFGAAGGTSSSGSYTISCTLGQTSVIGKSNSASNTISAGFWYCWNSLCGDANDDCIIDMSDLIFVRNNLKAAIDDGNWRADANEDGLIEPAATKKPLANSHSV